MSSIYLATPCFNPKEIQEMGEIRRVLVETGFRIAGLPTASVHEYIESPLDRLTGEPADQTKITDSSLGDLKNIFECDGLVLNLNGRVPYEGAVAAAGIAYALKKPVVGYHADVRTMMNGKIDSLVHHIADVWTDQIHEIPILMRALIGQRYSKSGRDRREISSMTRRLEKITRDGN